MAVAFAVGSALLPSESRDEPAQELVHGPRDALAGTAQAVAADKSYDKKPPRFRGSSHQKDLKMTDATQEVKSTTRTATFFIIQIPDFIPTGG